MGSGPSQQGPTPHWTEAGQTVPDPRDPPDSAGRARDFDFDAANRGPRQQQRQQQQQARGGLDARDGKQRDFIRVGDRADNQPISKVQQGPSNQSKERFKPKLDKKKLRATVSTKRLPGTKIGRRTLEFPEQDNDDSYVIITKPQLLEDDAEPYNKRPLPTFRRGDDVADLDEEQLQQWRQEELPLDQQIDPDLNIDGMDVDLVSYQPRLDPLPLLLPKKSNVPREEFLGTACGQDGLGVEDDGYARDLGKLPHGERANLLRIISQF